MRTNRKVAQVGCDCHRVFSRIMARNEDGGIIWRKRLEHGDRAKLREQLSGWPERTPVILEGTSGWGWLSDGRSKGIGSRLWGLYFVSLLLRAA